MPETRMQAVFDAGLDKISFSFDGETAEEYEKIRLGGKFEATLNNILHFLEIKKARGGKFPLVTIQVIKLHGKSDSGYISDEFKKKFAGLPVNEFILLYPYVWPGQEAQDFNRPHGHKYYPCKTPWTSLSLGWDGKVFWCCGDLNGKGILGDIHQNTLKEIWNGEKLRSMRRSFAKGDLKDLELCLQCEVPYHYVHPLFIDIREAIRQVKRYFK
jgi:radical SAM protein with 4Fe4S-binding SPASM domain